MKWQLPAKTFLVGEYAAIAGEAALVLTTTPCFELELTNHASLQGIHPDSPAARLWQKENISNKGLQWRDPYQGKGGLGASSAQFIACYKALCYLKNKPENLPDLLHNYYDYAFNGEGLRPSGYDVIAQAQHGCVYIDNNNKTLDILGWNFKDLGFLLVHTGKKLATHEHLQQSSLPANIEQLALLSKKAKKALLHSNSQELIDTINQYHQELSQSKLVAEHSEALIRLLKKNPKILASKGCGALGADIILLISKLQDQDAIIKELKNKHIDIIAKQNNLFMPQYMR